jgi:hypothetical protein
MKASRPREIFRCAIMGLCQDNSWLAAAADAHISPR